MARGEENLEIKARDPATEAYLVRALKTTIPLVLVETVSSLYSLADTYFVSGLGMEALAGVGVAGYIIWLYTVVFALFQTPLMILVSQSIGAELKEKAREVIGEACVKGGFYHPPSDDSVLPSIPNLSSGSVRIIGHGL
ncbi:MAG: MATE family efflux transporter [Thermosphaera sp.]